MKTLVDYTTEESKRSIANGSDTVVICGQTTLSRMLIKAPFGDQQVINERLILFFDIEPTRTAAGKTILGQVLELFAKLRRNHLLMPVALIFLGWYLRPALCEAIESQLDLILDNWKRLQLTCQAQCSRSPVSQTTIHCGKSSSGYEIQSYQPFDNHHKEITRHVSFSSCPSKTPGTRSRGLPRSFSSLPSPSII